MAIGKGIDSAMGSYSLCDSRAEIGIGDGALDEISQEVAGESFRGTFCQEEMCKEVHAQPL